MGVVVGGDAREGAEEAVDPGVDGGAADGGGPVAGVEGAVPRVPGGVHGCEVDALDGAGVLFVEGEGGVLGRGGGEGAGVG